MNTFFWLGVMVLFLIIEGITPALVSIWFALGALCAGICSYFGLEDTSCILVFAVVSAISIVLFKKFFGDRFSGKHERTNADRLVGEKGIVEDDIVPVKATGSVIVLGQLWSAKSDEMITKGTMVTVRRIEGVKLVVEKSEG